MIVLLFLASVASVVADGNAWRDDLRCGPSYPNAAGNPAECNPYDPDGYTCCSPYGWCGNTAAHCDCETCIAYYDGNAWRSDLRCGPSYPNGAGDPAECNPDDPDGYTCCSPYGWCGKTAAHCDCETCIDYAESQHTCPQDHPHAYYNGDYCCAHDTEKVYTPQGEQCDGSAIEFDSLCCKDDDNQRCADSPCFDHGMTWCESSNSYLSGYSSGTHIYSDLASAQAACLQRDDCGGITQEPLHDDRYTLRKGTELKDSPSEETSWTYCEEDEGAQPVVDPVPVVSTTYWIKYE